MCNVCEGNSMRGKTLRTCKDCLAESMFKRKELTEKTAKKFCECFKAGHDKTKLEGLAPLTDEYQKASKIVKDMEKEQDRIFKEWKERSSNEFREIKILGED